MALPYSHLWGRNWDNPDPIERTTCMLCGGRRDLEHESGWKHQAAKARYEDIMVRTRPETKWAEAKAAGWVSNYRPFNWATRSWDL